MASILLVGNGPNYFSTSVSWADVVRATAKAARLQNHVEQLLNEPLPLVYERIASQYPNHERKARLALASRLIDMKPNTIHAELMALNWANVLTTNYDSCLEGATGRDFRPANLEGETTYSVYRRKSSQGQFIWNIHGHAGGPRTMLLGIHGYAGYLQKLRRYLTSKLDGSPFVYGSQSDLESGRHSWADLFLRDDVHVVGLGLGYAEIDLWWLIGYKQRLKYVKGLKVGRSVYYQIGRISTEMRGRLELLQGMGVTIKHIDPANSLPTPSSWSLLVKQLKNVGGSAR